MLNCRPLLALAHEYADRRVELQVLQATYSGTPQGLEGQALRWVATADLKRERLLPADEPIVYCLNESTYQPL